MAKTRLWLDCSAWPACSSDWSKIDNPVPKGNGTNLVHAEGKVRNPGDIADSDATSDIWWMVKQIDDASEFNEDQDWLHVDIKKEKKFNETPSLDYVCYSNRKNKSTNKYKDYHVSLKRALDPVYGRSSISPSFSDMSISFLVKKCLKNASYFAKYVDQNLSKISLAGALGVGLGNTFLSPLPYAGVAGFASMALITVAGILIYGNNRFGK